MKKSLAYLKNNACILLLVCYFLLEFFTTLYFYFVDNRSLRVVGYYKLLLLLFLLSTIKINKTSKSIRYGVMGLFVLFCINQIGLSPFFKAHVFVNIEKGSFYFFIRFSSIFVFIMAFSSWESAKPIAIKLLKGIEKILIFNTFFILIGFLFEIKVFKSYHFASARFGYDGLFNKVNEVSYFYIILIANLYYQYITTKNKVWLLVYVSGVSLLLGTKTVLLFLGLLLLFHVVCVAKQAKKNRYVVALPLLLSVVYFKEIMQYGFSLFPFWQKLSEQYSLTTMLFSTRDLAFYRLLNYFNEVWGSVNYFIGGAYYTENFHRSEIDIMDVFIFFGALGMLVYLYLLGLFFFSKKNTLKNGLVAIVFISGFLGGGLLLSMLGIVYLYMSSIQMQKISFK